MLTLVIMWKTSVIQARHRTIEGLLGTVMTVTAQDLINSEQGDLNGNLESLEALQPYF